MKTTKISGVGGVVRVGERERKRERARAIILQADKKVLG